MITGVFIFEKKLHKDYSGNYYDTVFTKSVLERYASIVDKLILIVRANYIADINEEILSKYSEVFHPKVHIIEIPNVLSPSGLKFFSSTKKEIVSYLLKADIVFVRVPTIWQSTVANCRKKNNLKVIFEVGADAWASYWNEGGIRGKIFAPYIELSTRKVIQDSEYTVYVTDEWLQKRYPTKGMHIACSNVDIIANSESVLRERLNIIDQRNGKIIIGTLADVGWIAKGQQYIIEALAKLKKQGVTNFIYRMAGPGDHTRLKTIAKKLGVSELIIFDGLIRHDKIGDWFLQIDIYVQPSRQEGLPRALIEAENYALPSFGAKTGGIPELLDKDMIFSNTKNNINEICEILLNFTKEKLKQQAYRNFTNAKKFDKNIIEDRRHKFFLRALKGN